MCRGRRPAEETEPRELALSEWTTVLISFSSLPSVLCFIQSQWELPLSSACWVEAGMEDKAKGPRHHRFCKEPMLWRRGRRAVQKPGAFQSLVIGMGWVASFLCSMFGGQVGTGGCF